MDRDPSRCAVCGSDLAPIKHCSDCGIPVHAECYPPALKHSKFQCETCSAGLDAYSCDLCCRVWSRSAGWQPLMLKKEGSWSHAVCSMIKGGRKSMTAECGSCHGIGGRLMTCSEPKCSTKSHPSCALLDHCLHAQKPKLKFYCTDHDIVSVTKPLPDEEDAERNCNDRRRGPSRSAKNQARQSIVMDSVLASLDECLSERAVSTSSECEIAVIDSEDGYGSSELESASSTDSASGNVDLDDYDSDEVHGRGMSLYDSVHFRGPQTSSHSPVLGPDSVQILQNLSQSIEAFIADRIAKWNQELFVSILAYFETPVPALHTAVIVTGAERSDHLLRYQRLREFLHARDYRVAFLQNETSAVNCLWNIVSSLNERKTSHRPEAVLQTLALHNRLVVVVDGLESLNPTVVNSVIQRLTTLKNVFLIVGVSSHVEMLNELLMMRTVTFLSIREFCVKTEPIEDVLPELVFSSRLPVQFGPALVEYLQRVYESSNRSLRVLGTRIKTAIMLCLDTKSKARLSPSADAARDDYWRNFAVYCELLNNAWLDDENRFCIGGTNTRVEKFLALQTYNPANSHHSLTKFLQCLNACRNRSALLKMLNVWHDLFARSGMIDEQQQMNYILHNFDNLESLEGPVTVTAKTSKRNRRLLTAASNATSVPAVNIVSSRISAFLQNFVKCKLPPLKNMPTIKDVFFDNVGALTEISIENIESFVLQSLHRHSDSDVAQIFGYIAEATSLSVDIGSIFRKFACMNEKVDEKKLQVRFLQAIEDLCVLGAVSHSARPGYIDRVISLKSR